MEGKNEKILSHDNTLVFFILIRLNNLLRLTLPERQKYFLILFLRQKKHSEFVVVFFFINIIYLTF
jgi:hypothetical protein